MNNTNFTSRDVYNGIGDFDRYLVDIGYLSIIDWVLSMQPKDWCMISFQQAKKMYNDKLKMERKNGNNNKK